MKLYAEQNQPVKISCHWDVDFINILSQYAAIEGLGQPAPARFFEMGYGRPGQWLGP